MIEGPFTIRRRRDGGDDGMGNPKTPAAPQSFPGCVVFPGPSSEEVARAATVVIEYTVLVPDVLADILAEDEIEWDQEPGVWYPVEGKPGRWHFLDGQGAGLEVRLRGATG